MTSDSAIIDRLRDAAERVDVDLTLDAVLTSPAARGSGRAAINRSNAALVAACLVLIVGLAVAVNVGLGTDDPVQPASSWTPPISAPAGAPAPGEVAPHVARPPAWVGELVPGLRDAGLRPGTWVSTVIGHPTNEGFASPITVSASDGIWQALDRAPRVKIDGHTYFEITAGEWRALATITEPTIVAQGSVDQDTLHGVLIATSVVTNDADFTVVIGSLPSNYTEIVPPHRLGADATPRRTLAEDGGVLAINEISDLVDPLLAAAGPGADLTRHDLGGTVGWSGTATANPSGPSTFLVWSPEPGVVFQIDSTDPARPIDDLLELARVTTAIDSDEWDVYYPQ